MLATKHTTPTVLLSKEDRHAVRLLVKADKLRAELKQVEADLNRAVQGFGQRRGYMVGFYREYHMRSELRSKGVIEG